jgi:hypothetical protein
MDAGRRVPSSYRDGRRTPTLFPVKMDSAEVEHSETLENNKRREMDAGRMVYQYTLAPIRM